MMPVTIAPLSPEHIPACQGIARALPEWFGQAEGLLHMDADLRIQRGWVAEIGGTTVGFVTVTPCFPETWEITWLAVAPDQHRQGVGRRLVETVIDACREADAQLLLVKTLADEHPSQEYAQTRAFYRRLGFLPRNVFAQVWGEDNPCLLMIPPATVGPQ